MVGARPRGSCARITFVTTRTDLLADVVIAIEYRDEEYDAPAVVADIIRDHGLIRVGDLDPHEFAAILTRHRH